VTLLQLTRPAMAFGRYRLSYDPLELTVDGAPVAVGARALTLLAALVEEQGRPVSFTELANRVWGRSNVEINSVQAQVSALRRALGEDRDLIGTVAGYGYRFVGPAKKLELRGMAGASEPASAYPLKTALEIPHTTAARMPLRFTPFIGRHAELSELLLLMSTARVITLVGAPGLGKTRLAHELARRVMTHFPDGVGSVTLLPQTPPESLIRTLATALRMDPDGLCTPEQFAAAIGARRVLLSVDCCGPLRSLLGVLVDRLVTLAPALQVLVTGTAPLLIGQEQVVTVDPLRTPGSTDVTFDEALTFDAVRLLFTRLAVLRDADQRKARQHTVTDANLFATFDLDSLAPDAVPMAVQITRRLGGAPLAIELAASAIAGRLREGVTLEMALHAFATQLRAHLSHSTGCCPDAALSVEAAIATVLDLHYAALDHDTRAQLRWLGIFDGRFSRSAAMDMLRELAPSRDDSDSHKVQLDERCEARLHALLDVGLIEQCEGEDAAVLRLPGAVRLFTLDALVQTNELARVAAAHARSLAARLSKDLARGGSASGDGKAQFEYELELDEVRAALKWSVFNDRFEIAIALIEAAPPLMRRLSLTREYLSMIQTVLTRVSAATRAGMREQMRLRVALAKALSLTSAPRQEVVAAWRNVYDLASACADNVYRQRALAGLIACLPETWEMNRNGEPRTPYEGIPQARLNGSYHAEA
jgi:DNA-binding winged helix-turn-helix (wHTH) protein/predicted ATPase